MIGSSLAVVRNRYIVFSKFRSKCGVIPHFYKISLDFNVSVTHSRGDMGDVRVARPFFPLQRALGIHFFSSNISHVYFTKIKTIQCETRHFITLFACWYLRYLDHDDKVSVDSEVFVGRKFVNIIRRYRAEPTIIACSGRALWRLLIIEKRNLIVQKIAYSYDSYEPRFTPIVYHITRFVNRLVFRNFLSGRGNAYITLLWYTYFFSQSIAKKKGGFLRFPWSKKKKKIVK